jgi:hypothetical protein
MDTSSEYDNSSYSRTGQAEGISWPHSAIIANKSRIVLALCNFRLL